MDVKAVAQRAKTYVVDLFDDEEISNVGLEEVEFDDCPGQMDSNDRFLETVGPQELFELSVRGGSPGPLV